MKNLFYLILLIPQQHWVSLYMNQVVSWNEQVIYLYFLNVSYNALILFQIDIYRNNNNNNNNMKEDNRILFYLLNISALRKRLWRVKLPKLRGLIEVSFLKKLYIFLKTNSLIYSHRWWYIFNFKYPFKISNITFIHCFIKWNTNL